MKRNAYKLFSEGKIADLAVPNRLVRSATAEAISSQGVTDALLANYRDLARGGVGMIITGNTFVATKSAASAEDKPAYDQFRIEGLHRMAEAVHNSGADCRIVAQINADGLGLAASEYPTPFPKRRFRATSKEEIWRIEECFAGAIANYKEAGFDGVQLHGGHGYFLCSFVSPYLNRRNDEYGGCAENRARIVREIVDTAREKVGDFPILIKANCTDNIQGGIDRDTFPEMAKELERAGVDCIEVSGGIYECLTQTEKELGFRPVLIAEAHTRINTAEKQSYYLGRAEDLDLDIPVMLVGGNRDVERLEEIVLRGKVDFVAMCRPLIAEPELPNRWLSGSGDNTTDCISCNSCLFPIGSKGRPGAYSGSECVYKTGKEEFKAAQRWLKGWVTTAMR